MYELGRDALIELDLVITQGATNRYSLRWKAGEAPVDLTGYSARMQVRRGKSSQDAWLTLTSPSGVQLTSDGLITVVIAYAATEGELWDARDAGVYDLELTSPSGERTRFASGAVRVSHEVTRA